MTRRRSRLSWWLKLPLLLLPGHVRREHQRELDELVGLTAAESPGGAHSLGTWARVAVDALRAAPRAHWDVLRQDLLYALRQIRRSPAAALASVLTLGIGLAGTTTLFALVDGALLAPLPFRDAARLVEVSADNLGRGWRRFGMSPADHRDLTSGSRLLAAASAYYPLTVTVKLDRTLERAAAVRVDGRFFQVFTDRPMLGRVLRPEDDLPGSNPIVVSAEFWRSSLGADPHVIDRGVEVDGVVHRVVGVMPPGFAYPEETAAFWKPLGLSPDEWTQRGARYLATVARLRPGVTVAAARAAFAAAGARLAQAYPETNTGWTIATYDLRSALVGSARAPLLLIWAAAFLVLMIAVANVANLRLSQALARQREIALRSALGARPTRLFRQLVTEGLLLSVLAGGLGLLVGQVALGRLRVMLATPLPGLSQAAVGSRTGLVVALLVVFATFLFTVLPFAAAREVAPWSALRDPRGGPSRGRRRWQTGLAVAEVALAAFVLVGSALVIRTLVRLLDRPLGFVPAGVVTFRIEPPWHADLDDSAAMRALRQDRGRAATGYRILEERLRATPGVAAVGAINRLPLTGNWWVTSVDIADRPAPSTERRPAPNVRVVTPGYFDAVGTRVLRGRPILPTDRVGSEPVALIDETFARQEWGDADPIGSVLLLDGPPDAPPIRARIVGVVEAVPMTRLDDVERAVFYVPFTQASEGHYLNWGMDVVVRGGDMGVLRPAIERAARETFPDAAVFNLGSMSGVIERSLASRRFQLLVLAAFGAVALILSMVGVGSVLLLAVNQRARELGVHLALGAVPGQLWWRVQRQGLGLVAGGALIGVGAALAASSAFASLVYGVSVRDPVAFAAAPGLLTVIGFLAALGPAARAMRVDPLSMVRDSD